MFRQIRLISLLLVLFATGVANSASSAEKVGPQVLPENTLAMFRVASTPELIEKFQQTALGRIGQDEEIKPLVSQLYAAASEAFGEIQDRVGLPLSEILAIPQGEVWLALVGPEEGPPAVVAMIDAKDRRASVQKLIDKAEDAMAAGGRAERTTESVGDVKFVIYTFGGDRRQQVVHFQIEGATVFSSNLDVAKQVLDSYQGGEAKTLSGNKRFGAIMNRCGGGKEGRPQITWYADPIELAKVATRGNATAQATLGLMPLIGLDGLQGLGGSIAFGLEEFDTVVHMHILLDFPRAGVIDALALRSGDPTPEAWIPGDVASYMTFFWDVEHTYRSAAKMYNGFAGPGALEGLLKSRVSDPIGLDIEKELIPEFEGRFTMATRMEKPVRLNSQTMLFAAKLRDVKRFTPVFERLADKYKDNMEKKSFGGLDYYEIKNVAARVRVGGRDGGAPPGGGLELRPETPCVAIFEDYVIATNSVGFLEQAVATKNDSTKSLAKELDFKLIASQIQRRAGEAKLGYMSFDRPEEGMRFLYDLSKSENTKGLLARGAETNPLFRTLDKALGDNPLPPFEKISKYLAPGGGMITSDETGFHYTGFTLKRK